MKMLKIVVSILVFAVALKPMLAWSDAVNDVVKRCYKNSEPTICEETESNFHEECDPDCEVLGDSPFIYFQCANHSRLFSQIFNTYTDSVASNTGYQGLMAEVPTPCYTFYLCSNCDWDHDCSDVLDMPLDGGEYVYPQAVDPETLECPNDE